MRLYTTLSASFITLLIVDAVAACSGGNNQLEKDDNLRTGFGVKGV